MKLQFKMMMLGALVFGIGCGSAPDPKSDDTMAEVQNDEETNQEVVGEPEETEPEVELDLAKELYTQLQGNFSSAEQAARDPEYYDISLKMCPVSARELGDYVLYVEQALGSNLTEPHRQRLYKITQRCHYDFW